MTNLLPGDPAPWFTAAASNNPRFVFSSAGGRYIALTFFGSAATSQAGEAMRRIAAGADVFDDSQCAFFGISTDPEDRAQGRVVPRQSGFRFFWDFDRAVSRLYEVLDPDGATVGGFRTMVEAVAMRTFGLGGDSEVRLEDRSLEAAIALGPRRLVPLALIGMKYREAVLGHLERQLRAPNPGRLDGRFAFRAGLPERLATGLSAAEARLYQQIGDVPEPLDRVLPSTAAAATLDRLVARGLVMISGFTPSDAAHVLGRQSNWDAAAARLGAELFARRRDGRGRAIAESVEEISERVLVAVTRRSAEAILETAFAEDGLDGSATISHALVQSAIDGRLGIARLSVALDRPVIGLGASAPLHYEGLPDFVGNRCVIPEDTDVANALGAVVGQVRVSAEAIVSQPAEGLFRVAAATMMKDFTDEAAALAWAGEAVSARAAEAARAAGAATAEVTLERDVRVSTVEGQRMFIEARLVAVATGRPRIAE